MKTAMQELIEQLKEERDGFLKLPPHSNIQERTENCFGSCIEIAERMLQKEKEQIIDFTMDFMGEDNGYESYRIESALDLFNKTFNTNEK
jgi:hypothetical protein